MISFFLPTLIPRRVSPMGAVRSIAQRSLQTSSTNPPRCSFAFDIDGVLKKGEVVFPGTRRALKLLRKKNIPFVLITNGGGITEAKRCALLSSELEVEIGPNQLVQSHTPLRHALAPRFADEAVMILGGKNDLCRQVARSYGLNKAYTPLDVLRWNPSYWPFRDLSDEDLAHTIEADFSKISFKAIVSLHDSRDWGTELSVASEILQAENGVLGTRRTNFGNGQGDVEVVFCNPDLLWGNDYPIPRYGAGAFKSALLHVHKEATGWDIEFSQMGKPFKSTYDFAHAMLKENAGPSGDLGHTYMIGDNPASDIAGANAYGWSSLLVKTGVFRPNEGPPAHEPTRIVEDVEDGVMWALRKEGVI